jgi:hypothetical protein
MQSHQSQASLWRSHKGVFIDNAGHASTAAEYIMTLQAWNRHQIVSKAQAFQENVYFTW